MNQIKHGTRDHRSKGENDDGFTLVEILIAIVLVGVLAAVVVVGISNLTSKGSSSACAASADAAQAASVVYFTSNSAYPTTFTQMTTATGKGTTAIPAALTLPAGVTINTVAVKTPVPAAIGMQASSGTNWSLTMTAGVNGAAPTFVCS
jgi:prepilin-type N-terminal cleavage/methylation domain-containing protein